MRGGVLKMCPKWPAPVVFSIFAVCAVLAASRPLDAAVQSCESLASLSLSETTITSAQTVAAGAFASPSGGPPTLPPMRAPGPTSTLAARFGLGYEGGQGRPAYSRLPAFCRVTATFKPTPVSEIRIEVWLPAASAEGFGGWNGKFRGTGLNGLGGGFPYPTLATAIRDGYATASSNGGHTLDDSTWAYQPEKVRDFGLRSAHGMTVIGKAVTRAYYGRAPTYSYMAECGGASIATLGEVQRFPDDYNGAVVGGFAAYITHHALGQMWIWQATHKDEASHIPPEKFPVLHQAALDACDARDGVRDGVVGDPEHCAFDPGVIQCKGADGPACLTAPQVDAARKIYAGPVNPRTGKRVYSPLYPGSELDWGTLAGPTPIGIATTFLRDFAFKDPNWDYRTRPVNFDSDVALADRPENLILNSIEPDISKFAQHGGKLILAGGWNNAIVPPGAIVDYYKDVVATIGAASAKRAVRLYMVPGISECNSGQGTDTFDMFRTMEQWVERGRAPQRIRASRAEDGKVVRTRPLCPYPQLATYTGTGSTDDAANFVCK